MPDLKISELPAATAVADGDLTPFVQVTPSPTTKRASLSQLRRAVLADRGVDVRDFGAVGNGTANDAPAIQAAINALGAAGGTVHFGARNYRLNSAVTISGNSVRLQGVGFAEGGNPGDGTWFTVGSTGFTPITFTGIASRGSAVRDIAIRQNHGATQNAAWAPTGYDFFFKVLDCLGSIDFDNVMLSGVNKGIYCDNSGRLDLRRIRGQVFTTGIEIDRAYDAVRLMNIHFWPFWSANDHVVRWQQANGDALVFRRVDGVFIDQSFVLGYRSMFRFSSSAHGHTQKFSIGQAYADFVKYGLWIDADGTDGQIDAMTTQGEIFNGLGAPVPGATGIHVGASNTRVQIGNLRVDDAEDHAIRIEQHSNRIDIGALRCVNYNLRDNGAAAIHLAHATAGLPNRVNLGSTPLLEAPTPGPLFNAGSNGSAGLSAPAGEEARPGLSLGDGVTGLFMPVAGSLAAAASGAEVLRAAGGTVSLGGAPGSHGLEVTTPSGASNRAEMLGAASGSPSHVGWRAGGADANIGTVLGQPKGTGALLAQFPDSSVSGGNARGTSATDLQTARTTAAQVASGTNSTISGGVANTASGSDSTVAGGRSNTASGLRAAVGGGTTNVASGGTATVAGGNSNSASGSNSWVPGGTAGSTRAVFGRGAWSSGSISTSGDAQAGEFVLRCVTSDATATPLISNGSGAGTDNQIVLPSNGTYLVELLVTARQASGSAGTPGDSAAWTASALVRRGAAASTTVIVGSTGASLTPAFADGGATAWRIGLAADTANGALSVTATGAANKTIRWVARALTVETSA